jgi:hypothetical protein
VTLDKSINEICINLGRVLLKLVGKFDMAVTSRGLGKSR